MKRLIALLAIAASAVAIAQQNGFNGVNEAAMKGDYQAQRNLAYGYATRPLQGQNRDAGLACAWYLVVLRSDSPKLTAGDVGNVKAYCDKLDFEARLTAERKANALYRSIYGSKP